jgi:hypothetical protein
MRGPEKGGSQKAERVAEIKFVAKPVAGRGSQERQTKEAVTLKGYFKGREDGIKDLTRRGSDTYDRVVGSVKKKLNTRVVAQIHPASYTMGTGGCFRRNKAAGA